MSRASIKSYEVTTVPDDSRSSNSMKPVSKAQGEERVQGVSEVRPPSAARRV